MHIYIGLKASDTFRVDHQQEMNAFAGAFGHIFLITVGVDPNFGKRTGAEMVNRDDKMQKRRKVARGGKQTVQNLLHLCFITGGKTFVHRLNAQQFRERFHDARHALL